MEKLSLPHNHGGNVEKIIDSLPSESAAEETAEIFAQMSDGRRLRIFLLLCRCEECVINISAVMDMSSPAVSHHLKQLKAAGLITSRREGKEVYYRAAEDDRTRLVREMAERLMPCGGEDESSDKREVIKSIHTLITENPSTHFTIEELSKRYFINTSTLKEQFKAVYGMPIAAYMKEYRINRACELLAHTNKSVAEIAADMGYSSQSKFTERFREHTGMSPTAYRKQKRED